MSDYRYCLRGDIDLETAPAVRADLRRAIEAGDSHLLIDCTFLTFIDSTGVALLLEAHRELEAQGRYMLIANVPTGPRRVLQVLGLTDLLHYDRANS